MLTYLHVKNIALIDELEVDFHTGFNIMTGETGAGKSIIIGSINAVLGNKIPKDFVRKDEEYALIELIFYNSSRDVFEKLQELEINHDGEVLISRRISQNGRSVFKINGQVVNMTDVKEITSLLIDLHSQHEHQSLLEKKNHIKLVDRYLGEDVERIIHQLKAQYKKYNLLKSEIKEFSLDQDARKREIGFLEYEINEISSANLMLGEDHKIEAIFKKQSNMQVMNHNLASVYDLVSGNEQQNTISSQISKALEYLYTIKNFDGKVLEFVEQLEQIDLLTIDFARDIFHYIEELEVDEEALTNARSRMDLMNGLKMKHGNKIEDILEILEQKKEKLEQWVHYEESLSKIQEQIREIEKEMIALCTQLTKLRVNGSKKLAELITESLNDLNLKDTKFEIKCLKKETFGLDGWDDIEFLISTNLGEELKPLIQIASGGEISRIMLAIKSVFADCDEISTLIFDEIDTGISGRTAQMVAEKMVSLSRSRQIISITHLPQIASMADAHYLIDKNKINEKNITNMTKLKDDEIPHELARLIGGAKITESILKSAVEMKNLANEVKKIL